MKASQLSKSVYSRVSQGKVSGKAVFLGLAITACQFRKQIMVREEKTVITSQLP